MLPIVRAAQFIALLAIALPVATARAEDAVPASAGSSTTASAPVLVPTPPPVGARQPSPPWVGPYGDYSLPYEGCAPPSVMDRPWRRPKHRRKWLMVLGGSVGGAGVVALVYGLLVDAFNPDFPRSMSTPQGTALLTGGSIGIVAGTSLFVLGLIEVPDKPSPKQAGSSSALPRFAVSPRGASATWQF